MIPIPLISEEEIGTMSIWIPVTKAYRYKTIPTDEQRDKMVRTLEACRHLFNWALGERKEGWENGQWNVKYKDQQDYLPVLRNGLDKRLSQEEIELGKELRDVYEQVEQNVLNRVEFSYQRFFERVKNNKENPAKYKKPGHPRFKGRNRMKSFTFPQYGNGCNIVNSAEEKDEKGDYIRLSQIGDIKFIKHIEIGDPGIPYQIKTITMKKEVDKWIFIPTIQTFVELKIRYDIYKKKSGILKRLDDLTYSLLEGRKKNNIYKNIKKELDDLIVNISKLSEENGPKATETIRTIEDLKKELDELNKKYVGNDMGLPNLMTDSNGKTESAPKYLEKSLKRLRKEQQKLAKKEKYDVFETDEEGNLTEKVKRDPKTGKKIWIGSKNRDKQVEKVAKVHRRIGNQRLNYNHIVSKEKVKDNESNIFEKLDIQEMMSNRRYARGIADAGWGQVQRFTVYKAERAGKKVDFVDPVYTSKTCSDCGILVENKWIWIDRDNGIVKCPFCGLEINIHENAARNIRNRSPMYQLKLDMIYQRLSSEMKENIGLTKKRLTQNIYCWSLDPEDSFTGDDSKRINRDAAARIYAFGEVTSTFGQVASSRKEGASPMKDRNLGDTIEQAPPAIGEAESGVRLVAHPSGRGS